MSRLSGEHCCYVATSRLNLWHSWPFNVSFSHSECLCVVLLLLFKTGTVLQRDSAWASPTSHCSILAHTIFVAEKRGAKCYTISSDSPSSQSMIKTVVGVWTVVHLKNVRDHGCLRLQNTCIFFSFHLCVYCSRTTDQCEKKNPTTFASLAVQNQDTKRKKSMCVSCMSSLLCSKWVCAGSSLTIRVCLRFFFFLFLVNKFVSVSLRQSDTLFAFHRL